MIVCVCSIMAWVLFAYLSWRRFKTFCNPTIIVLSWWYFWIAVASLKLTGLDQPTYMTWVLFFAMTTSYGIGTILGPAGVRRKKDYNPVLNRFQKRWFKVFFTVSLPPLLLFAWRTRNLVSTLEADKNPRTAILNAENGHNVITGTTAVRNLIEVVIAGPLLFFTLVGVVYLFKYRQKLLPLGAFILTLLYQSIELGRSLMYRFVLLALSMLVLYLPRLRRRDYKQMLVYGVCFAIPAVGYIQFARATRNVKEVGGMTGGAFSEFVVYHTVGFTLFDVALMDRTSPLNTDPTLGLSTLSGFDTLTSYAIKILDPDYVPFSYDTNEYIYEQTPVGFDNSERMYDNAYYTILFPLYRDGRIVGVIIGSLILGLLTGHYYLQWKRTDGDFDLIFCIFIVNLMTMGLFLSPTEKVYTFTALITMMLVRFGCKRFARGRRQQTDEEEMEEVAYQTE